ncbi:pentapeptide repeat-containing protein [Acaryochloris sp. IP29b_bin.148]|uniref:pentapeptide repeat-containing protein n=1 Tax=Acaryochloris sp. IP29b_bin.148 TaxID=2969218 RepID=UPI002616C945|nr:pentapeptide repeat-containing protein [Acaryochloris sp. IP29b_bin.148]
MGDPKYVLIRSAAIAFAAWGGTSFRAADLTSANFNHACLKSADLRQATLNRTSWLHTCHLDRLRPGSSFLSNPQIRTLVQTGQGQGIDLTHLNLRGINLADAQLKDACCRATDLSEATLSGANLTRANLVQTQLDQTDLTGAILTGATIEDWGITGDTNLQGVRCEYVYMHSVKEGDPDPNPRRKPDNYEETFAEGEFGDFIKPIVDTLDLYHNQNVDSGAIAIAFKQLAENNPEANLEIVAMEKRGQDKFLLRAKTPQHANHSQLSQQYFADYNQLRSLPNQETQRLIAEKDDRIRSLENFVEIALKRPSFYAENYQQRGDLMSENSGVNINTRDGNVSGVAGGDISGVINLGNIQGDIHNAIQQLPSNPSQPNLKDLLNQLQTAIAEEPELDDTEKAAALAQVKKLAEAGQAPQDSRMKQLATKATGFLKGIAGSLTAGAKLVTAWDKVGPAIMSGFGLL